MNFAAIDLAFFALVCPLRSQTGVNIRLMYVNKSYDNLAMTSRMACARLKKKRAHRQSQLNEIPCMINTTYRILCDELFR